MNKPAAFSKRSIDLWRFQEVKFFSFTKHATSTEYFVVFLVLCLGVNFFELFIQKFIFEDNEEKKNMNIKTKATPNTTYNKLNAAAATVETHN